MYSYFKIYTKQAVHCSTVAAPPQLYGITKRKEIILTLFNNIFFFFKF